MQYNAHTKRPIFTFIPTDENQPTLHKLKNRPEATKTITMQNDQLLGWCKIARKARAARSL